jgi:FKBP-type peptidyl-prolyl cis-trans isomerase 2
MKKIFAIILICITLSSCWTNTNNLKTNNNIMEKTIVVDTNHPLAWKTLNFDLKIVSIDKKWAENNKKDIVEKWDLISVDYTWTFTDGKQFDSSIWKKPLQFTAWAGQMIPWFDKAVIWMKVWEEKKITLKPEEAYGDRDPNRKQEVKLSQKDIDSLEAVWYKIEKWWKFPTQFWELEILEVK